MTKVGVVDWVFFDLVYLVEGGRLFNPLTSATAERTAAQKCPQGAVHKQPDPFRPLKGKPEPDVGQSSGNR